MPIDHGLLAKGKLLGPTPTPLVMVAVGACFAVATALLLVGAGSTAAILLPLAIATVLVAISSPYWALVITIAQFAFVPCEGELFGYFIPNVLQLLAPLCFGAALLYALKEADHERLAPRATDFFVGGFGIWGLVSMFASGVPYWKWYGNRMLFPMMLYFAVRLLPVDRKRVRMFILVALAAIALQSLLMIRESVAGSSPIYQVQRGLLEGIKPAKGPFPYMWNAGTYLVLWPSLFIYAIASSRDSRKKLAWGGGLLVLLGAASRIMQRAPMLASLIAIASCLVSPRLRRTTLIAMSVLALAYVPWSMGRAGSGLISRFQLTDESRYAYRTAGINLLKSPNWDPIFGIGWGHFSRVSGRFGTEEEITVWEGRIDTVAEIASGSALHNVWLAIPVEFGGVGTLLFLGILGCLGRAVWRIWRYPPTDVKVDDGLLVSMMGSLLALAAIGYYQNIYTMPEAMSVLWVFYGLLTGQPSAFFEPRAARTAREPNA